MSNFAITEQDKEVLTGGPIGVGIHEDVTMIRPTLESLKEGNPPLLKLNFQDSAGRTHSDVVWDVQPDQTRQRAVQNPRTHGRNDDEMGYTKGDTIKPDEAVAIAYADLRTKLKHVATKFVSEKDVIAATAGATSYEDLANKFIGIFTDEVLAEGNPIRLKLASKPDGYATVPKYPPFMENMTISAEASRLKFSDYESRIIAQTQPSAASNTRDVDPTDFNPVNFEEKATF